MIKGLISSRDSQRLQKEVNNLIKYDFGLRIDNSSESISKNSVLMRDNLFNETKLVESVSIQAFDGSLSLSLISKRSEGISYRILRGKIRQ